MRGKRRMAIVCALFYSDTVSEICQYLYIYIIVRFFQKFIIVRYIHTKKWRVAEGWGRGKKCAAHGIRMVKW